MGDKEANLRDQKLILEEAVVVALLERLIGRWAISENRKVDCTIELENYT